MMKDFSFERWIALLSLLVSLLTLLLSSPIILEYWKRGNVIVLACYSESGFKGLQNALIVENPTSRAAHNVEVRFGLKAGADFAIQAIGVTYEIGEADLKDGDAGKSDRLRILDLDIEVLPPYGFVVLYTSGETLTGGAGSTLHLPWILHALSDRAAVNTDTKFVPGGVSPHTCGLR